MFHCWGSPLTQIHGHADEDDKAEPGVEICAEVDDGDDDISDGWKDAEHYVAVRKNSWLVLWLFGKHEGPNTHPGGTMFGWTISMISFSWESLKKFFFTNEQSDVVPKQAVNRGGSTVDASQHLAGFAAQMPAQRQGVQVGEQADLNHSIGELLHPDPEESTHVTDKPRGTWKKKSQQNCQKKSNHNL